MLHFLQLPQAAISGVLRLRIMVRVFVTGGTGFVGSRLVKALVAEGHAVSVLSRRTSTDIEKLHPSVVHVQGSLADLDIIAAAAADADAVYHLAFDHDFSKILEACEQDAKVVNAIVDALSGSGKLFVNTSVTTTAGDTRDELGKETMIGPSPRAKSEVLTSRVGC